MWNKIFRHLDLTAIYTVRDLANMAGQVVSVSTIRVYIRQGFSGLKLPAGSDTAGKPAGWYGWKLILLAHPPVEKHILERCLEHSSEEFAPYIRAAFFDCVDDWTNIFEKLSYDKLYSVRDLATLADLSGNAPASIIENRIRNYIKRRLDSFELPTKEDSTCSRRKYWYGFKLAALSEKIDSATAEFLYKFSESLGETEFSLHFFRVFEKERLSEIAQSLANGAGDKIGLSTSVSEESEMQSVVSGEKVESRSLSMVAIRTLCAAIITVILFLGISQQIDPLNQIKEYEDVGDIKSLKAHLKIWPEHRFRLSRALATCYANSGAEIATLNPYTIKLAFNDYPMLIGEKCLTLGMHVEHDGEIGFILDILPNAVVLEMSDGTLTSVEFPSVKVAVWDWKTHPVSVPFSDTPIGAELIKSISKEIGWGIPEDLPDFMIAGNFESTTAERFIVEIGKDAGIFLDEENIRVKQHNPPLICIGYGTVAQKGAAIQLERLLRVYTDLGIKLDYPKSLNDEWVIFRGEQLVPLLRNLGYRASIYQGQIIVSEKENQK